MGIFSPNLTPKAIAIFILTEVKTKQGLLCLGGRAAQFSGQVRQINNRPLIRRFQISLSEGNN